MIGRNEINRARGSKCPYCQMPMIGGQSRPTRDHCVPRSRGGNFKGANKVICCNACNGDKGNMTILEWHAHLFSAKDYRAKHVGHFIQKIQWSRPDVFANSAAATVHRTTT